MIWRIMFWNEAVLSQDVALNVRFVCEEIRSTSSMRRVDSRHCVQ